MECSPPTLHVQVWCWKRGASNRAARKGALMRSLALTGGFVLFVGDRRACAYGSLVEHSSERAKQSNAVIKTLCSFLTRVRRTCGNSAQLAVSRMRALHGPWCPALRSERHSLSMCVDSSWCGGRSGARASPSSQRHKSTRKKFSSVKRVSLVGSV